MQFFLIFIFSFIPSFLFSEENIIVFNDKSGDDHGTGTYIYPSGNGFDKGSYDLIKVVIEPSSDSNIYVEAHLRTSPHLFKNLYITKDERKDIFLQIVDIYIDSESEKGFKELLPGRRAQLIEGEEWEKVLIVTSLKNEMRKILKKINPLMEKSACFPSSVNVTGKVIKSLFKKECTGEISKKNGFLITLSSITYTPSIKRWMDEGKFYENFFLREITRKKGNCPSLKEEPDGYPCTFGGCEPCENHPRIIDAIIGGEKGQEKFLLNYDKHTPASLPMLYPEKPLKYQVKPLKKLWSIVDRKNKILTLTPPQDFEGKDMFEGKIGFLVCEDKKLIGNVVITGFAGKFIVVEIVEEVKDILDNCVVNF